MHVGLVYYEVHVFFAGDETRHGRFRLKENKNCTNMVVVRHKLIILVEKIIF